MGNGDIISITNGHVHFKILDYSFILSIENWFAAHEVNFQDDNAFCYGAKGVRFFFSGKACKFNDMVGEQSGFKSNRKFLVDVQVAFRRKTANYKVPWLRLFIKEKNLN